MGVAYGTEPGQGLNILVEVAKGESASVQSPEPFAFFTGYGDNTLNFELWVCLLDISNWFPVQGRLYQQIEQKLRAAKIEIPFPQRDLHLRSVDQPLTIPTVPPPKEKPLSLVEQKSE